jgi:orotidine-5'-phosphate decarboxylase
MTARSRLCFALDFPSLNAAREAAKPLSAHVGVLKVGLELFTQSGPDAVKQLGALGPSLFLDLKLHDIPATVERAVAVACGLGVKYLTLHASGGPRMLEAAQQRAEKEATGLHLLGVTVLTSSTPEDLQAVGIDVPAAAQVQRLAKVALGAGLAGLVCSVEELSALRAEFGPKPLLVAPGIRPSGAAKDDQTRVGTAEAAIRLGASLLVVGRPIRDAADPCRAAQRLVEEIEAASKEI